jgi:hypothetical protein
VTKGPEKSGVQPGRSLLVYFPESWPDKWIEDFYRAAQARYSSSKDEEADWELA